MSKHIYTEGAWPHAASSQLMHRPRLYNILDEHISCPYIGIMADSGFGKTYLIEGYLMYTGRNTLYFSFSENTSLEESIVDITQTMLEMPDINAVVFDNCGRIAGDATFAGHLQHLSVCYPACTFFLVGTSLPLLPYALLKGRNEYYELTHEDLALTPEELFICFEEFWDLPLEAEEINAIHSLTRGWFASVQLLYSYLKKRKDDHLSVIDIKFISGITDISNYISYTFYESQPVHIQSILRKISAATDLDKEILEGLLGPDDVKEIFHAFDDFHGLIYTSKDGRLNLHPLLRHFLYLKHMQIDSTDYLQTHKMLTEIYEKRRQYISAFAHAIAANSYYDATRIMKRMKDRYNPIQLLSLLDGTLDEISPALLFSNTTMFLLRCMPEELMLALVQPLTETICMEANPNKLSRLQHRLGCIQFHLGNIHAARRLLENSLSNALPYTDTDITAFNYQLLADCFLILGDIEQAVRNARNAMFLSDQNHLSSLQFHSLEVFSRIRLRDKDLDQAKDYLDQANELISVDDYENFWLHCAMSAVDQTEGNLSEAILHAQKAIDIVSSGLSGYDQAYAHLMMAQALILAERIEEATQILDIAYKESRYCHLLHAEVLLSIIHVSSDKSRQYSYEQELQKLITENEYSWVKAGRNESIADSNSSHSLIHIQVFGHFSICCNAIPITIKRSASLRLLLLLIANQRRWLTRDYIVDVLFPSSTPSSGINQFNVALSVLRKTLDAVVMNQTKSTSCILRDRDRYQINLKLISLQSNEFEQQYMSLKKSNSADYVKWMNLYGLYSGGYLPEYPYESFLELERERFTAYQKDILLILARHFCDQGDINNAWIYYEQAQILDPYDEELYYESLEVLLDFDAISWARLTAKRMQENIENNLGIQCSDQIKSMFDYYYKQKKSPAERQ